MTADYSSAMPSVLAFAALVLLAFIAAEMAQPPNSGQLMVPEINAFRATLS